MTEATIPTLAEYNAEIARYKNKLATLTAAGTLIEGEAHALAAGIADLEAARNINHPFDLLALINGEG